MTRLVTTKLLAPQLPGVLVPRHHLHSLLAPEPGRRVSLVVGPPGAGKTTLAREWLAAMPTSTRWGWFTLDADDDEPGRLAAALVAVVRAADLSLGRDAGDLLVDADQDPALVVEALVDEIAHQASSPLVVVLDDAHQVGERLAWEHIAWLVDHQPTALHLVILTRVDPPLPLARWRARGQLGEIRTAQLALRESETHELLTRAVGPQATASFCMRVHECTEGWAAGVRLASLALDGGASPEEVVTLLSAPVGTVAEVLVDEVLGRESPSIRRFLLDTSVVATLEPGLCGALTERPDAGDVLHHLASDHLFIRRLEGRRHQYRHHQLFGELLRAELMREDPTASARLHRRAADWFEQVGMHERAITHLLAAGDYDDAVTFITAHRDDLYVQGHTRLMSRWLDAIPKEFIAADPARVVNHANLVLLVGSPEQISGLRGLEDLIPTDAHGLRGRALRVAAMLHGVVSQFEAFEEKVAEADQEWALDPVFDPIDWCGRMRIRLLSMVGRHDEAIALAERNLASESKAVTDDTAASLLAGVLAEAGQYERAAVVADHVLERWWATGAPELYSMVEALRARAIVHRLAGQYTLAGEHLEFAHRILEGSRANLINTLTIIETAALETDTGHAADAVRRLDRLELDLRAIGGDSRLLDKIKAARQRAAAAVITTTRRVAEPQPAPIQPEGERLTDRELVILRYLPSRLTLPELASELLVSRNTIKTQVAAIYRKLGATSRSEAVELGRSLGLIGSAR